jgi:hypothetical protein
MADDVITQMVNDPDFGKLSPVEQRKALAAHDPIFAKVNDDEISKFITAHHVVKQATGVQPITKFSGTDIPVSPSRIPASMTGHPEEGFQPSDVHSALPMAGGAVGGAFGGVPGAGLGGAAGESLAELIDTASTGKPTESPITDIAKQGALQGALEGGGQVLNWAGGKLAPLASQSLARILRLSPKAFQFGREPAQEVLESGLAGGSLEKMAGKIGDASKQVTSQLTDVLKKAPGTVDVFSAGAEASKSIPNPDAANRFEQLILDSADKLGLKNLSNLSNVEANALKQEVAKQARFVEGDLRPSIANAAKQFGGKIKDNLIANAPEASDLLETSANLTEASKGADYAVRAEKAGQGKGGLSAVDIKKPSTYPRLLTDTPTGANTLFKMANMLKDHVGVSAALRTAFQMIYPQATESEQ